MFDLTIAVWLVSGLHKASLKTVSFHLDHLSLGHGRTSTQKGEYTSPVEMNQIAAAPGSLQEPVLSRCTWHCLGNVRKRGVVKLPFVPLNILPLGHSLASERKQKEGKTAHLTREPSSWKLEEKFHIYARPCFNPYKIIASDFFKFFIRYFTFPKIKLTICLFSCAFDFKGNVYKQWTSYSKWLCNGLN